MTTINLTGKVYYKLINCVMCVIKLPLYYVHIYYIHRAKIVLVCVCASKCEYGLRFTTSKFSTVLTHSNFLCNTKSKYSNRTVTRLKSSTVIKHPTRKQSVV